MYGINTNADVFCFKCNKKIDYQVAGKVFKSDECEHCGAVIRCCKMCHYFDKRAYNECREPTAERIVDKEKSNFCNHFVLDGSSNHGKSNQDTLTDAANSLFKD